MFLKGFDDVSLYKEYIMCTKFYDFYSAYYAKKSKIARAIKNIL